MSALAVIVASALVSTTSPASGQTAEPLDSASVGIVDPASMMDVDSFVERAVAWAAAQVDRRAAALVRAEELAAETKAAETKAAETAERERQAAEEAARRAEQDAARREAEEAARRAAAAETTTTTVAAEPPVDESEAAPESDNGAVPESDAGAAPQAVGPTSGQWQALRSCESNDNYQAVSPTGRYRGAYQFSISTWDWLAGSRFPELAGVDPIAAGPADQDKMAFALYDIYGSSPWPVCGRHLP